MRVAIAVAGALVLLAGASPSYASGEVLAPSIDAESATHIAGSEATLEAQINPEGGETEYQVWVIPAGCPGCLETPPVAHGTLAAGTVDETVTAHASNLAPGTGYVFWVTVKNAAGFAAGNHEQFTTAATTINTPTIDAESATHITGSEATLEAQINPEGGETEYRIWLVPASCSFGCLEAPPVATGRLAAGSVDQTVTGDATNLAPATAYVFWVTAKNAAGFAAGNHERFTTAGASPLTQPLPIAGGSSTVVSPVLGALHVEASNTGPAALTPRGRAAICRRQHLRRRSSRHCAARRSGRLRRHRGAHAHRRSL